MPLSLSAPPTVETSDDRLWTVKQASAWLSLTEHALRTMLRRNQLPAEAIIRIGRRIRFRSDSLRAWIGRAVPA